MGIALLGLALVLPAALGLEAGGYAGLAALLSCLAPGVAAWMWRCVR
ncbi:hypothetical protein ACFV7Q_35575 [Streptomyces sp. NPDC059851]